MIELIFSFLPWKEKSRLTWKEKIAVQVYTTTLNVSEFFMQLFGIHKQKKKCSLEIFNTHFMDFFLNMKELITENNKVVYFTTTVIVLLYFLLREKEEDGEDKWKSMATIKSVENVFNGF